MTPEQTGIRCAKFQAQESLIAGLTHQINAAKTGTEKASEAKRLMEAVEVLLSCDDYSNKTPDCQYCRGFSQLRQKSAELILKAWPLAR
jgi:hypothetical protein